MAILYRNLKAVDPSIDMTLHEQQLYMMAYTLGEMLVGVGRGSHAMDNAITEGYNQRKKRLGKERSQKLDTH